MTDTQIKSAEPTDSPTFKLTCPHDGGTCHHNCDVVEGCFREAHGMSLSQPNPDTPGAKADTHKPQPRLIPPASLMQIVDVLTYGAHKYAPHNWKKVPQRKERYTDALLRHIYAWLEGEKRDAESGLHHLAHAGCCVLFLLHFDAEEDADG